MKLSTIRTFAFSLLILMSLAVAKTSFADDVEHVTVSGTTPTEDQVALAKHKIALIQTDPGYYYSGAAGALHRKEDVEYERKIIELRERMPASTK
jgi:hypothetical protein